MSLLLASWLLTQCWSFPPVEGATAYRVYYSSAPDSFLDCHYTEHAAADVCDAVLCEVVEDLPGWAQYITIVAVNEGGESPWEPGREVQPCP